MLRSHYCGDLRKEHVGSKVNLSGWVDVRRDLGSLVFIDLRDRSGISQIVFSDETGAEAYSQAGKLRSEFVLSIRGTVAARTEKNINPDMVTGEVEVEVEELEILNPSEVLRHDDVHFQIKTQHTPMVR